MSPSGLTTWKKANYILNLIFYWKDEEIRFTSDKSKALLISWYLSSLLLCILCCAFEIAANRSACFRLVMAETSSVSSAVLASDLSRNFEANFWRKSWKKMTCFPDFFPTFYNSVKSNRFFPYIGKHEPTTNETLQTFLLSCQPRWRSWETSFSLSRFCASSSGPSGAKISLTFCHS